MDEFLTIYAIGDFQYIIKVLEATAMFGGSDGHRWGLIAAIGAMVGLILAAGKSLVTGGKEFDIQYTLIGWIIFMVMFSTTATVTVENAVPANSQNPGASAPEGERRPVAGVPFGVAAMGAFISHLGYGMTKLMEQAFGSTSGYRVSEGGFGKTLDLITLPMALMDPRYASGETVSRYSENLENYLGDCYLDKKTFEGKSGRDLFAAHDVCAEMNFPSAWSTTEVTNLLDGTKSLVDCKTAYESHLGCPVGSVVNGLSREAIIGMALKPAVRRGTDRGSETLAAGQETAALTLLQELDDAFASVGADEIQAVDVAFGAMVVGAAARAMGSQVMNSPMQMQQVMLAQASGQRATQWAAEETMFRRVMRPMMSFFEAIVYAIAPFMCFLVAMGRFGLGLMVKYLVLTIWVQLWLPILAIVNLYMNVQAEQYLAGMALAGAGLASPTDMLHFWSQSLEWIGTAGMLAAATPALTFMLIFGGAYSAQALAGRLQGGDHTNEKMVSPDLVQPGALVNQSAQMSWNPSQGLIREGSAPSMTSLGWAAGLREDVSSSRGRQESTQATMKEEFSKRLSTGWGLNNTGGNSVSGGVSVSSGDSWRESASADSGTDISRSGSAHVGSEVGSQSADQASFGLGNRSATSGSHSQRRDNTTSKDSVMGSGSAGAGGPRSSTSTSKKGVGAIAGEVLSTFGITLEKNWSTQDTTTANQGTRQEARAGSSESASRGTLRDANGNEVTSGQLLDMYNQGGAFTAAVNKDESLKAAFQNAQAATKAYSELAAMSESEDVQKRMNLAEAATRIQRSSSDEEIGQLRAQAISVFGAASVSAAEKAAKFDGVNGGTYGVPTQAAALAYLAANVSGRDSLAGTQMDDDFRRDIYRRMGFEREGLDRDRASENSDVANGVGVQRAGELRTDVEAMRPDMSESQVVGAAKQRVAEAQNLSVDQYNATAIAASEGLGAGRGVGAVDAQHASNVDAIDEQRENYVRSMPFSPALDGADESHGLQREAGMFPTTPLPELPSEGGLGMGAYFGSANAIGETLFPENRQMQMAAAGLALDRGGVFDAQPASPEGHSPVVQERLENYRSAMEGLSPGERSTILEAMEQGNADTHDMNVLRMAVGSGDRTSSADMGPVNQTVIR